MNEINLIVAKKQEIKEAKKQIRIYITVSEGELGIIKAIAKSDSTFGRKPATVVKRICLEYIHNNLKQFLSDQPKSDS